MNRILMVAFHYPPCFGSSGLQRTLKFSRYLPEAGWQPTVLTISPGAHPRTSDSQLGEIPDAVTVHRAVGLDAQRHLSILGRFPGFLLQPDRWASWRIAAVAAGKSILREQRPDVIWSTFPIASAIAIGQSLQQASGLPWVADLRDSMTEDDYPVPRSIWRRYRKIERRMVTSAARIVFTTPGALKMYAQRYPTLPEHRCSVIPNGYDEADFSDLEPRRHFGDRITLVHSGILYPAERNPGAFFKALHALRSEKEIATDDLCIVLRASGHDEILRRMIMEHKLADMVVLAPGLPYRDALAEMKGADGVLLFQGSDCNHQVPAKLYEYLRSGSPILAFTDRAGDTARTLKECGVPDVAAMDSVEEITALLRKFLQRSSGDPRAVVSQAEVSKYERRHQAFALAKILDGLVSGSNQRGV